MNTNRTIRTTTAAAAAILFAGLWTPAFAEVQASNSSNSSSAVSTRVSPDEAENRRICVREQLTGSRLNRTICRTRAEWQRAGGLPTDRD